MTSLPNPICRKETTLWKRWEQLMAEHAPHNGTLSRKETTLWKRWEPLDRQLLCQQWSCRSEGNYSLKEMRTTAIVPKHFRYDFAVGRKLLSERDENVALPWVGRRARYSVGRKLLSERDENVSGSNSGQIPVVTRRKETTLWKRWERCYYETIQ